MKGMDQKVLEVILIFAILVVLLFIGLAIIGGTKETANPITKTIGDLVGVFK